MEKKKKEVEKGKGKDPQLDETSTEVLFQQDGCFMGSLSKPSSVIKV